MLRRVLVLFVVLAVPVGAGAWIYELWLGQAVDRARRQPEGKLGSFLDDRRQLVLLDWLRPPGAAKDAGPFLNPRLRWREAGARVTAPYRHVASAPPDKITVPLDLASKMEGWKSDFLEHAAEIAAFPMELRWLRELLAYDHWNPFRNGPLEDDFRRSLESSSGLEVFLFNHSFMDLHELMNAVKIRWARAVVQGDTDAALAETRHLARLCFSGEDLALSLIGVAIVGHEPIVHAFLRKKTGVAPSWTPVDAETKNRLARYVKAFPAYFNPLMRGETLARVFSPETGTPGECTAVREGMGRMLLVRPIVEPTVAGEPSLEENFATLDRFVAAAAKRCRLDFVKELWEKPDFGRRWLDEANPRAFAALESTKNPHPVWFFHVPYVRRIYGYLLAGVDPLGAFDRYDRPL